EHFLGRKRDTAPRAHVRRLGVLPAQARNRGVSFLESWARHGLRRSDRKKNRTHLAPSRLGTPRWQADRALGRGSDKLPREPGGAAEREPSLHENLLARSVLPPPPRWSFGLQRRRRRQRRSAAAHACIEPR